MMRLNSNSHFHELGRNLIAAERLYQLGARPPIVRILCNLGRKVAIRIYKETLQVSPMQGLLPYDPYWIVHSSVNAFHASVFISILNDILQRQNQTLKAQSLITSYELYCQVIAVNRQPCKLEVNRQNTPVLNINRAWQLIQQFNTREILLIVCDRCRVRFCTLSTVPRSFQQCPICDVWTDKDGRRRWTSVRNRQGP